MKQPDLLYCFALICSSIFQATAMAEEDAAQTQKLVKKIIATAGGKEKLLTRFRMKEQFNTGKKRVPTGKTRNSVLEPPQYWWLGKKERGKEPAKFVVWAWTLGILTDTKSKIETIPDITENGKSLVGLRVTGSVNPALDMYFDKTNFQLERVDWRKHFFRFSEWKEQDGAKYPSKCVIYTRSSGKPWFFHEILSIERLPKLPDGLKR